MARVGLFFSSTWAFIFSALWLLYFGALQFWPASWWMEVRSVQVTPAIATAGAEIPMVVDREIVRPFYATWTVNVRNWDGAWAIFCQSYGGGDYKVGAIFPKKLTLRWWTNGQCPTLPAGKYMLTTTWVIGPLGLMPDKEITVDSNVFEVKP